MNTASVSTTPDSATKEAKKSWLLHDLFWLTKPTITLLVVVTAVPGLLLASDELPSLALLLKTLLGATFASASAAVFNQLMEVNIDNAMTRTKKRSLPAGRIQKWQAILWGTSLGGLAFCLLFFGVHPLAAYFAIFGHLFYVLLYTGYLKTRTPQNIVIGGAAGAVGPLIGCAAYGYVDASAWVMFFIITMWTPPHFWALALNYKDDYAKAGIPMYPVVYGDEKTRQAIFLYTLTLFPLVAALTWLGKAGALYFVTSMLLTARFSWLAFKLYRSHSNQSSMPLFYYSCIYTFGVFTALAIDRLVGIIF